jgi:peptide-O-fucosyltransferase
MPVLVFGGAITPYPMLSSDRHLQQYLKWTHKIADNAETIIEQYLTPPYIAVHLRNGDDWRQACTHAIGIYCHFLSYQTLTEVKSMM